MKKWKLILISLVILAIFAVGGLGFWVHGLNSKITDGLANKKFLPPTEYFSAPEYIRTGGLLKQKDLEALFQKRSYRLRTAEQKLLPGDYSLVPAEECKKNVPVPISDNAVNCLFLVAKDVGDPELNKIPLQMVALGKDGVILQAFQGNPLEPQPAIALEPELIAQFLEDQPIMQTYTPLGQLPPNCMNAVLAIEDPKFLEHSGVSYRGIVRAILSNLLGRHRQGGSTITQQLVKNYFLSPEKTIKRKAVEFFMSLILETHQSKDEILETYLNIIYMGQNGPFQVRGFPAAAQYYFQKPISDLELHECALLAAVLNSPGLFDPFKKQAKAVQRRSLVLEKMHENNMITEEEAKASALMKLPRARTALAMETAPYYIDAVKKQLASSKTDLIGAKIFTGLSLLSQKSAQEAVIKHLSSLETGNPKIKALKEKGLILESSLLSADNSTGLIKAVVGGRNFKMTQFNRAIEGHRQIGSIMKPFVYLAALIENSDKYTPLTILKDEKFTYKYEGRSWSPENYGGKYYGDVPMYFALKSSLNAATANVALDIGLKAVIATAEKLGVTSKLSPLPSVSLGSFELYTREVLEAYVALSRLGLFTSTSFVRSVMNEEGKVVYRFQPVIEQRVDRAKAAVLVGMMKQTVLSGTAKSVTLSGFTQPAAGKTGTTSDNKDAWFAAFTPDITTVVWIGYDDNTPHGLTGASGAVPIWIEFMKSETKFYPEHDWEWPAGTKKETINVTEPESEPTKIELIQ